MKKEIPRHSIFTPNNRWIVLMVVWFVSSVYFVGCATITGNFAATGVFKRSNKQPHEILLVLEGNRLSRPYTKVGIVNTDWWSKGVTAPTSKVFQALKNTAARNGLDGVTDIHCAGPGTIGEGLCSGNGFVFN